MWVDTASGRMDLSPRIAENINARGLLQAPQNVGNLTFPTRESNIIPTGVRQPAVVGQYYPVPDDSVYAYANALSTAIYISIYHANGENKLVKIPSSDVQYVYFYPQQHFKVLGQRVELTNVTIKLTRATAFALYRLGKITIEEMDAVSGNDIEEPPTVTEAVVASAGTLMLVAIAALAIWLIPKNILRK